MADETTRSVPQGDVTSSKQVADAVTQSNVMVGADAPAMSLGVIYEALASGTEISFVNAINLQQQTTTAANAAAVQAATQLYSVPTAETADAVSQIDASAVASLIAQLGAQDAASTSRFDNVITTVSDLFRPSLLDLRTDPENPDAQLLTIVANGLETTYVGRVVSLRINEDEPSYEFGIQHLRNTPNI